MGKSRSVLIYAGFGAMLLAMTACSDTFVTDNSEGNTDTEAATSHTVHTDVAQGIWPPQPLGMTNVEGYPASARSGAEQGVIDSARRALMSNPETRAVLGDSFRQFDGSLGDSKSDVTASFLFYNYLNNTTVEARLKRTGAVVNDVFPASVWQPPEHSEEVAEAIALGQVSLAANGYETAGLQGTAMLAFPQVSQIASSDRHYYPERVLYVTFGEGDGALPVYSARVTFSSGTVTESGLVR